MTPRKLVAWVALCGAIAITVGGAARLGGIGSSGIENTAISDREATRGATPLSGDAAGAADAPSVGAISSVAAAATSHLNLPEPAVMGGKTAMADPDPAENASVLAGSSAAKGTVLEASSSESRPTPRSEPRMQLVTLSTLKDVKEYPKPVVRPIETPNECLVAEICIDDYLWSLYERAPKIDTNKVTEQIKTTVKVKGKTRTVVKTVIKYVAGDFTWKDPIAAQRAGMSLKDYVIGGLDRGFKLKLHHALRTIDDAGFMPGITSAFRDDYRQSIASGNRAASDSSYHGGSRRGGYGHALAVDLVSVKGETRAERYASSEKLWQWIDEHEQELGIGRPYLGRDPPHVAPIDGKEYADKRGRAKAAQLAGLKRTSPPANPK
ncbi:MAG: peptidase M15 [Xanthobacteraceae bacterium]|nr:peptidase M15 [Xanthobacteraceae bacterium]